MHPKCRAIAICRARPHPTLMSSEAWNKVSLQLLEDPHNFDLWQQLVRSATPSRISKTTPDAQIQLLKTSYDSFLRRWPLAYKYWVLYATKLYQSGRKHEALTTYDTALTILPYSIELWTAYLQFRVANVSNDLHEILDKFETARSLVGHHFFADEFYVLYLNFLEDYARYEGNQDFERKYVVLLRLVVEIPLYNHEIFSNMLVKFLSDSGQSFTRLSYLVPQDELKRMKKSENNNLKMICFKLRKRFTDLFIATQYRTYELFKFEMNLKTYWDIHPLSQDSLGAWRNYLSFIEMESYPHLAQTLAYERCVNVTANHEDFWLQYADHLINRQKYIQAEKVLHRGLTHVISNERILIKLVDVNIANGNILKAKDLLASYYDTADAISARGLRKLAAIEASTGPEPVTKVIGPLLALTKDDSLFQYLINFNVPSEEVFAFLESNFDTFGTSPAFWRAYVLFATKYQTLDRLSDDHKQLAANINLDSSTLQRLAILSDAP